MIVSGWCRSFWYHLIQNDSYYFEAEMQSLLPHFSVATIALLGWLYAAGYVYSRCRSFREI